MSGRDGELLGIGAAAARAGVSERSLRYYQQIGLLTPAASTPGGMRRYSQADLDRVTRILELKSLLGLDLDTIAIVLRSEDRLAEIREANLSYMMLAQSLIRSDREQALFRLGISEETANMISSLTPAQMMKIASGNTLLCRFRMDDDLVWNLITSHGKTAANETVSRLHASILMAGRHQEAA